jgi:hypothetical protein
MDPKTVVILLGVVFVAGAITGYGIRAAASRIRRARAGK